MVCLSFTQHLHEASRPSCSPCSSAFSSMHNITQPHSPEISSPVYPLPTLQCPPQCPSPPSAMHRGITAHQPLSPGLQLCIRTISCVVWPVLHPPTLVLCSLWNRLSPDRRGRKEEGPKQASPGLQSITGPPQVPLSASWDWELKRSGILETREMGATVELGQHWTWAVIGRFKHNFTTENKMKMITNCRLQM